MLADLSEFADSADRLRVNLLGLKCCFMHSLHPLKRHLLCIELARTAASSLRSGSYVGTVASQRSNAELVPVVPPLVGALPLPGAPLLPLALGETVGSIIAGTGMLALGDRLGCITANAGIICLLLRQT